MEPADTIDFFALPRREFFRSIETPSPFEQSLAPQYLVDPRNTPAEIVRGIEKGGVRVRDLIGECQHFPWNGAAMLLSESQMLHRGLRPNRPMAEQATCEANWVGAEIKLG